MEDKPTQVIDEERHPPTPINRAKRRRQQRAEHKQRKKAAKEAGYEPPDSAENRFYDKANRLIGYVDKLLLQQVPPAEIYRDEGLTETEKLVVFVSAGAAQQAVTHYNNMLKAAQSQARQAQSSLVGSNGQPLAAKRE